jgi:leader peptidase (prepilin peptidase)/N-methyltransferase
LAPRDACQDVTVGSAPYAKFGQLLVIFVLCAIMLTSLLAGAVPDGLLGAFLAAIMIAIALVDAKRYIIPNEFTLAALALALVRAGVVLSDVGAHPVAAALLRAAITAAIFWLLSIGYRHFRGREGFGLGDVKLLGVAAAWLDWPALLVTIEGATLAALLTYLLRQWIYRKPMKGTAILPFGTFLAPFIWVGWLIEALLN